MADQRNGGIAWTDESWNPIRGCSRVSEGCRHCYAETVAHRFSGAGQPYEGLTNAQGRWNGTIRVVEEHLLDPTRWRRPRRVFVNSMSDLFHESISDETIDRIFAVMALAYRHTFQVLTKRPERMRDYLTRLDGFGNGRRAGVIGCAWSMLGQRALTKYRHGNIQARPWPLPNVWLGVSVEDQATADARIPLLLQTPAAVRFISAEPLLGPVDLWKVNDGSWYDREGAQCYNALRGNAFYLDGEHGLSGGPTLDWVIVGGESGPKARPCDVRWIGSIVEQCKSAGVACFVKQLGAVALLPHGKGNTSRDRAEDEHAECLRWPSDTRFGNRTCDVAWNGRQVLLRDKKGGDISEFPEDLRVREFPR